MLCLLPSLDYMTMGSTLRQFRLLRELGKRHAITVVALSDTEPSPDVLKEFAAFTEQVVVIQTGRDEGLASNSGTSVWSKLRRRAQGTLRLRSAVREMRAEFHRLVGCKQFDLVVFNGEDLYPVVEGLSGLPLVADICDATPDRYRQWLRYSPVLEWPWRAYRYIESKRQCARLLRQTPFQVFITKRDRNAFQNYAAEARVIPNGIDLNFWVRRAPQAGSKTLIFTGVMNYPPNADAAHFLMEKVLPQVRTRTEQFEVLIVGRNPRPELLAAARHAPEVVVTGAVPDLRPYLERASVFVAPLRFASGMQNKALEAMAMELPVIASPVVAEGLQVDEGGPPPVCLARNAEDFARQIIELFENEDERLRLAAAGRRYVESHFDWQRSAEMFESLCQAAVAAQA